MIGPAATRDSHASGEVRCSTTVRTLADTRWSASANESAAGNKRGFKRGVLIRRRASLTFDEMYASLADRSTRKLLKRLARLDVLLIDEFGYLNLKPEQSNIFFKLMEERYRQHPTIITTNLGYDEWPNFLGNRPMVEALLSRLRHYCHTVHIKGPSLRDLQG